MNTREEGVALDYLRWSNNVLKKGANGKGHLTTMDDPAGLITFGYDPRGRLVQKTSTVNSINYPVTYAYTPGEKVGSVTYPSGRVITYDRNPLGKISEVTASGIANPLASGLTYKPFGGPLQLTNGFGGTVNNQAGECDCLTVSNPGQPRERTYGYDPNRNLTSITGTTTPWYSQTFGYDQLNRLTGAAGRYGSIAYTYDDVGNRLTRNTNGVNENYTYYTGTNRLQQITGGQNPRTFGYDANGNITDDGTLTFIYDQNNQLVEVEQGATNLGTYSYNGLGQRVVKQAGANTTVYHYDLDGKLIAETLPNGTMTKEYLYMGKVRVAMVDVAGGNALYHYLNDRLGTPEILTNATGTVAWEAWYEPFGEAHIHPSSSVVNNIRLPGQYYDAETGLHYNYHRYYDPRTGRYLTPDPIGLLGTINLYPYGLCNPISHSDSRGLFLDSILDIGFIVWDLWDIIAADNPCERDESLTALGLDVAGLAVPFATGFGRGYKGLKTLDKASHSIKSESKLYHYTTADPTSIAREGLKPGASGKVFTTPQGGLSPLQAQIDLALPPNRGLPGHLVEIDVQTLKKMRIEVPAGTQIGRGHNMPGGGIEVVFPHAIPPAAIKAIR